MGAQATVPFGAETFGFPSCNECAYPWSTTYEAARGLILEAPTRYAELLEGRADLKRKRNDRTWSPSGYVWHVSDWLRIQAQRIYGMTHDPEYRHVGFEQDDVAALFRYDELSTPAGLWALERSVGDFERATDGVDPTFAFDHPVAGRISITDLVRYVGHEVPHHDLDIRRGLGLAAWPDGEKSGP